MDEKYFSGDIGVWKGDDCIDGFIVIFENIYNISGRYMGNAVVDCFMNKICEKYGNDFDIDAAGSENTIKDIILKK